MALDPDKYAEYIEWVATHLGSGSVREDAPSAIAWSMLQQAEVSPSFREEILKKLVDRTLLGAKDAREAIACSVVGSEPVDEAIAAMVKELGLL